MDSPTVKSVNVLCKLLHLEISAHVIKLSSRLLKVLSRKENRLTEVRRYLDKSVPQFSNSTIKIW